MSQWGIADLPLHEGHVPEYLLRRMKHLGSLIARYIVDVYGPSELLKRLSDPLWFQAFNNVIGMDWDSSGSTTIVHYVLKNTFPPSSLRDFGLAVLGGKGRDALGVKQEALLLNGVLDARSIIDTSRFSARLDSIALQDGYTLYIHGLYVSEKGGVLVVQQGMNVEERVARRYHIYMVKPGVFNVKSDPHSGVASHKVNPALNLLDEESDYTRRAIVEILESTPIGSLVEQVHVVNRLLKGLPSLEAYIHGGLIQDKDTVRDRFAKCPIYYRPVRDVNRIEVVAERIKKLAPREFHELLLIPGLGPESLRAIALVADLIYGYTPSFKDPTTHPMDPFLYAYAHGGKDGVPYRVKPREIDKTIEFFAGVLNDLKTGSREKEILLRNLAKFVGRVKRGNID